MNDKEKKAFVARMKKGKKAAAKGKKQSGGNLKPTKRLLENPTMDALTRYNNRVKEKQWQRAKAAGVSWSRKTFDRYWRQHMQRIETKKF